MTSVVQRTWFSWLDNNWGKASCWVTQLNKQRCPASSSNPAVLSIKGAGHGCCLSLLELPVAQLTPLSQTFMDFLVWMFSFVCWPGRGNPIRWKMCWVSTQAGLYFNKIYQPEKKRCVMMREAADEWLTSYKQSPLEQGWCYNLTDDTQKLPK